MQAILKRKKIETIQEVLYKLDFVLFYFTKQSKTIDNFDLTKMINVQDQISS